MRQTDPLIAAALLSFTLFTAGSASGAVFAFDDVNHNKGGKYPSEYITVQGEISPGDAARLTSFLLRERERTEDAFEVRIESTGGNVAEAMKIGRLIRSLFLPVSVGRLGCMSACFLVYVGALDRYTSEGTVGVHRAFFHSAVAKNTDLLELDRRQRELSLLLREYMSEMEVPAAIQDRLQRHASTEILWLSSQELLALGLFASFWEEALVSRCGLDVAAYRGLAFPQSDEEVERHERRLKGFWTCKSQLAKSERRKALDKLSTRNKNN